MHINPSTPIQTQLRPSNSPFATPSKEKEKDPIRAELIPFFNQLKGSRNLLTYNTETHKAEVWNYPTWDIDLELPVEHDDLEAYCKTHDCKYPTCFCPHLDQYGGSYANSYPLRIFVVRNGNPKWNGCWIAACAERVCGYWFPLGRARDAITNRSYFTQPNGPAKEYYFPRLSQLVQGTNMAQASSSSLLHALDESLVVPASQDSLELDQDNPSPADEPQLPQTPTPKQSRKNKGKEKREPTPPPDFSAMLHRIPNLADAITSFLKENHAIVAPLGGSTASHDEDFFYKSPSGALTGPLPPASQRRVHPYKSAGSTSGVVATKRVSRKRNSVADRVKQLAGLLELRSAQPEYPHCGLAIATWHKLNDPDFPGVPPEHFLNAFWQCDLCDQICVTFQITAHKKICRHDLTNDNDDDY